jgi:hypothetical protein
MSKQQNTKKFLNISKSPELFGQEEIKVVSLKIIVTTSKTQHSSFRSMKSIENCIIPLYNHFSVSFPFMQRQSTNQVVKY